jgi:hypothetical protein
MPFIMNSEQIVGSYAWLVGQPLPQLLSAAAAAGDLPDASIPIQLL